MFIVQLLLSVSIFCCILSHRHFKRLRSMAHGQRRGPVMLRVFSTMTRSFPSYWLLEVLMKSHVLLETCGSLVLTMGCGSRFGFLIDSCYTRAQYLVYQLITTGFVTTSTMNSQDTTCIYLIGPWSFMIMYSDFRK